MTKVSEHFDDSEFFDSDYYQTLKAGGSNPAYVIDKQLVLALEDIREHFNEPVKITSGYRTLQKHLSLYVGKRAPATSQHLFGRAADIVVSNVDPIRVQEYCRTIPEIKGLGSANTFTHIDCRFATERVEWSYS